MKPIKTAAGGAIALVLSTAAASAHGTHPPVAEAAHDGLHMVIGALVVIAAAALIAWSREGDG